MLVKRSFFFVGEAPLISSAICVTEDGKNSFFD